MTAHPHADFVKPLVEVLKKTPPEDTHLRQAAKVALRNCLRDMKEWPEGDDAVFVEIATAIPDQKAARYLLGRFRANKIPADKFLGAAEHAARYGLAEDEADLFKVLSQQPDADAVLAGFKGVQARGAKLAAGTAGSLRERAESVINAEAFTAAPEPDRVKRALWGLRVLNALPSVSERATLKLTADSVKALRNTVGAPKAPGEVRVGAAEVLLRYATDDGLDVLRKQLADPATPESVRTGLLLAAATSSNADAQQDARDALATVPYRIAVPVALALASSKSGTEYLLNAVRAGKAPARLLQERALLERMKASNAPDWQTRVAELTKNLPAPDQRINALLKTRGAGFAKAKLDKEKGAKLFTQHCAACHKIGDQGGKIAPQLDGVGIRGPERLLEDVLDPNRNVDSAFRARAITLTDDKTLTALMLRVEGQVLVVADLEGKEQRIPLKDIATNRETQLSAMPANFADVIPEEDLYHIIAYLLEQKAKEPPKK